MKQAPEIKIPLLSYLRLAINNPLELRTKIFQSYGDIARKKVAGVNNYYLAHPIYVQAILNDHQDNYFYRHPFVVESFSPYLGNNGLITSNYFEQWHKDRLLAQPHFDPRIYFKEYSEVIVSICNKMLCQWQERYNKMTLVNVAEEIDILILNITRHTLFTHLKTADVTEFARFIPKHTDLAKARLRYFFRPLWYFSPLRKQYDKELRDVLNFSRSGIRERLEGHKQWDDILSDFLHEYTHLDKERLIDYVSYHTATFSMVSYYTSASSLHWLLVILSQHPIIMREICTELDRVIGSRLPQYEDLNSLPYLSAVIKESFRLNPAAFGIMRQSLEDDEINGFYIPGKAGIILSTYHLHRHPSFWENPEGFDPLRFIDNPFGQENRFAYIPFGAGNRNCIATAFATMEIKLLIVMILQRFRVYLPANVDVKPYITTILNMRPDVKMMYIKRC